MHFKGAVLSSALVLLLAAIPAPSHALRMDGGGLTSNTECFTSYVGVDGVFTPSSHWCITTWTYESTGEYYGDTFDSLDYWGGGGGWYRELNMLPVPGNWNGEVKVNKTGTKAVATGVRCVGDEDAFRQQVAQAAMGVAQAAQLSTSGPFPIGRQLVLNMDGGDTQTFTKTSPSTIIVLSAGTCKPGS